MSSHSCVRALLMVIVPLVAGCHVTPQARYLEKTPETGVIALPVNTPENRALADSLMRQHFPDGYMIEREAEINVGSVTEQQDSSQFQPASHAGVHHASADGSTDHDAHHPPHGGSSESRTISVTRDTTEWRIFYSRSPSTPPLEVGSTNSDAASH